MPTDPTHPTHDPDTSPNTSRHRLRVAHRMWASPARRAAMIAAVAVGLATTGAAAGYTPWSGSPRPELAPSAHDVGDETGGRDRSVPDQLAGADRSTTATTDDGAGAGDGSVSSSTSSAPSSNIDDTTPATTATTTPKTTPDGEVASQPGTFGEPTTSVAAPRPTDGPSTSVRAEPSHPSPAAPATSAPIVPAPDVAAPDSTSPTTAPVNSPANSPATSPKPDRVVPQTIALTCVTSGDASGNSISCTWTGSAGSTFAKYLVLRGRVGSSRGVVLASSTNPSGGSFADGGLVAGTYSYVVVSVDANDTNTGHSNPIQVTIAASPAPTAPPLPATTAAQPTGDATPTPSTTTVPVTVPTGDGAAPTTSVAPSPEG